MNEDCYTQMKFPTNFVPEISQPLQSHLCFVFVAYERSFTLKLVCAPAQLYNRFKLDYCHTHSTIFEWIGCVDSVVQLSSEYNKIEFQGFFSLKLCWTFLRPSKWCESATRYSTFQLFVTKYLTCFSGN